VFGCPGLRHTPDSFLIGLAAKILISLVFSVILLFAPLVIAMANYKPGANIVKDQALRFKGQQSSFQMHLNVAKAISLLGFSLLGLIAAAIIVPVFSTLGLLYQVLQVTVLLLKGLCSRSGIRDEDDLSGYDSPSKSPYQSPIFFQGSITNMSRSPNNSNKHFKINLHGTEVVEGDRAGGQLINLSVNENVDELLDLASTSHHDNNSTMFIMENHHKGISAVAATEYQHHEQSPGISPI